MALLQTLAESLPASAPVSPGGAEWSFAARLGLDLLCATVLIRLIYFRRYRRTELLLTFFSFNLVIFLLTFLLNRVEMTLGAAFGLFAVFSMLRYRTEGIAAKDMTYLFLVIALGLLMAVGGASLGQLALIGAAILACTALLEGDWVTRREHAQPVLYDNLALVGPQARQALLGDLRARTGLDVHRVDVHEIDLLRDVARLTVYYRAAVPTGER
jgi:hypothetical protein